MTTEAKDLFDAPAIGPRILTLDEQKGLLVEVGRLRTWVAATVLVVELNALDAGAKERIRRTGRELLNA